MSSISRRILARTQQGHSFYRRCYGVSTAPQESSCPFGGGGSAGEKPASFVKTNQPVLEDEIKPFEAIPCVPTLPFGIGTLHKYLPYIGEYSFKKLHHSGRRKMEEFGPIVRENIVSNVQLLLLFDPKDIEQMYLSDGRYPMRRSHMAIEKYRLDRPHMYSNGGFFPTNGKEWYELRSKSQKVMNKPQILRTLVPELNKICQEFLQENLSDSSSKFCDIDDFLPLLNIVFQEMIIFQTLDTRVGAVGSPSPHYKGTKQDSLELCTAAELTNRLALETDNGFMLWKLFDTPVYKQIIWSGDILHKNAIALIEAKEAELSSRSETEDDKPMTLLGTLILESGLDKLQIVGIVCDALMASSHTGSFTLSFILYHLARNPEKQSVLAQELHSLMDASKGEVTPSLLNSAKYLKAAVKEAGRLNPISVGIGRTAKDDIVIRGYKIPKDTILVSYNQVACRLPEYFPDPDSFIPERWFSKGSINPYLVLPFGHGPRMCIGRRIAEQSMYTLLAHLIHNFHLEWRGTEMDCNTNLINEPDQKLRFRFIPRKI